MVNGGHHGLNFEIATDLKRTFIINRDNDFSARRSQWGQILKDPDNQRLAAQVDKRFERQPFGGQTRGNDDEPLFWVHEEILQG
jgi:hypothetical protein